MLKSKILKRLEEMEQMHLAQGLDSLAPDALAAFLEELDVDLFFSQREKLKEEKKEVLFKPIQRALAPQETQRSPETKTACLILAGGQASRLGISTPKALIPIIDGKTLLEIHLEKIGKNPCAIITSFQNHGPIEEFLHHTPFTPLLVQQAEAPFLSLQGDWILRAPGKLACGPDGNGHALHLLHKNGVLDAWEKDGVECISVIYIDNPLADPLDPILIGSHIASTADITLVAVSKDTPEENVGIFVEREGRIVVQEYSEMAPTLGLAYTGICVLNLSFAKQVVREILPWHMARKQDPITGAWIWKSERFIFDILEHASKTHLLLYPRGEVFAPLKNSAGKKSLATVQEALRNHRVS